MITAIEARAMRSVQPVGSDEIDRYIRRTAKASSISVIGSGDFDHRPLLTEALAELQQAGYTVTMQSASNWTIKW